MILISPKQYKANLHCHSVFSDGRLTPEKLKAAYKEHGYSVLAITDHERPRDHSDLTDDGFVAVTGYEAYIRPSEDGAFDMFSPEVHLNLLAKDPHNIDLINWNDKYVKYVKDPDEKAAMPRYGSTEPRRYTKEYINSFIATAREHGYLVTLNHPVWSLEDFDFLYDIRGYFSLEICNFATYNAGMHEYDIALYEMLLRRGKRIFCHSADDNHNPTPLDVPACDSFGGFAMLNTENDVLSYDAVMRSLEKGDFYSSMGPVIEHLEISDGKAYIRCSDAVRINMFFGAKNNKRVYAPAYGEYVNEAEFDIPRHGEYVRFSVTDEKGRTADTRGYFKDELI